MNMKPELIVMLTHNDVTVKNAFDIFEECKDTRAKLWGFKEVGLPVPEMKKLCFRMKECGKTTFLEIIAQTEEECLEFAKLAVECEFDYLIGTTFSPKISEYARSQGLKYIPFVGDIDVEGNLHGTIQDVLDDTTNVLKYPVEGINLLAYRFEGDANALIDNFTATFDTPLYFSGSINSYERLDKIKACNAMAFTIGGAFFEHKFGDSFAGQIETVIDYLEN